MLTDRQEHNLKLLFDPRSVLRLTADDRAAGAALLEEVGRLRAAGARDGAALRSGAEENARLEADVGRLTAERDAARATADRLRWALRSDADAVRAAADDVGA